MNDDMQELARQIAEETGGAVPVELTDEFWAEYRAWWDSLSPEEQDRQRDGMVAT